MTIVLPFMPRMENPFHDTALRSSLKQIGQPSISWGKWYSSLHILQKNKVSHFKPKSTKSSSCLHMSYVLLIVQFNQRIVSISFHIPCLGKIRIRKHFSQARNLT